MVYTMDKVDLVPPKIALIAGNVIQNLRSALDHIAYRLAGIKANKDTAFPIAKSKREYEGKDGLRSRRTRGMPSAAVAAIDAIKPFQGGNEVLWRLNKLNNIDKHRLILTVGSAVCNVDIGTFMKMRAPPGSALSELARPMFVKPKDNSYPLKVGTEIFRDKTSEEVVEIPIAFEIAISETGVIDREPLLPELQGMIDTVEKVITDLMPLVP
jgi:hypothetical protein